MQDDLAFGKANICWQVKLIIFKEHSRTVDVGTFRDMMLFTEAVLYKIPELRGKQVGILKFFPVLASKFR